MCERHRRNKVWGVNGRQGRLGLLRGWEGAPFGFAEPAAVWLWVECRWLHCCLELCSPACTARAGCAGGISVCCQVTLLPAPCTASTLMGHCSLEEWFPPHTAQLKEHQCVFRGLKPASIFFQLVFIHCQSSYFLICYLPEGLTLQLCLGWVLWDREFLLVQDILVGIWVVPVWYCCQ